uniref:COesterase domain-containing protein n=1 Tax=Meloidogyne hapla TaxID=6305 RepID=A0A1I8C1Y7_MELHA
MTLLLDQTIINEMRLAVSPVIDGELVPKSPKELRDELDVCKPVICGHSQHEGLLFLAIGMRRANNKLLDYCKNRMYDLLKEARKRMPNEQLANKLIPKVDEFEQLYNIPKLTAGKKQKNFEDKTETQNTVVAVGFIKLIISKIILRDVSAQESYGASFNNFNWRLPIAMNFCLKIPYDVSYLL